MPAFSKLAQVVKLLTDKDSIPVEQASSYLQKRGVKPDELKGVGLDRFLAEQQIAGKSHLTGADLDELVSNRADEFSSIDSENYDRYKIRQIPGEYRSTEYNYSSPDMKSGSLKASTHYENNPDYLAHVRSSDTPERNILFELQSDAHETASRKNPYYGHAPGYGDLKSDITLQDSDKAESLEGILSNHPDKINDPSFIKDFDELAEKAPWYQQRFNKSPRDNPQNFLRIIKNSRFPGDDSALLPKGLNDLPFKKDKWSEKILEREIDRALSEGKSFDFLYDVPDDKDIPLRNSWVEGDGGLMRGDSYHDKYYADEGKHYKNIDKLAKKHGLEVEDLIEEFPAGQIPLPYMRHPMGAYIRENTKLDNAFISDRHNFNRLPAFLDETNENTLDLLELSPEFRKNLPKLQEKMKEYAENYGEEILELQKYGRDIPLSIEDFDRYNKLILDRQMLANDLITEVRSYDFNTQGTRSVKANIKRVTDPKNRGGIDYEMYTPAALLAFLESQPKKKESLIDSATSLGAGMREGMFDTMSGGEDLYKKLQDLILGTNTADKNSTGKVLKKLEGGAEYDPIQKLIGSLLSPI